MTSVTPRDMALVRGSFEFLRPRGAVLMERFYTHLFQHHPYIKPLFRSHDMGRQRIAFMGVLTFLVQSGGGEETRAVLAELGAKHAAVGATAGHYPAIIESLLSAAAATSGELWTDEVQHAWTVFMAFVTHAMLEPPGP